MKRSILLFFILLAVSTAVSADQWLVRSGDDVLEIREPIGPHINGVIDFIDDKDLDILADGQFRTTRGSYSYEQFLHFNNSFERVEYMEDGDDNTDLFFYIKDNRNLATYELNFNQGPDSTIDASDNFQLKQYIGRPLQMLGKTYLIFDARTGGANSHKVSLRLLENPSFEIMGEGESRNNVTIISVDPELRRATLSVNGDILPNFQEGDTYVSDDGTIFGITNVIPDDTVELYFADELMELEDDDITDSASTDEVVVNYETIDGAEVTIKGLISLEATDDTDGELLIDSIEVSMNAQDDYFIGAGENLLQQSELEEKDLLFTTNWDFYFDGLSDVKSEGISIKKVDADSGYTLTFTNINGEDIVMPLAYANGDTVHFGDSSDALRLRNVDIQDEDYFILNDRIDEHSVTNIIQYKGADDDSKSDPIIKFKILSTGEVVSRPFDFQSNTATLKISGTTYTFENASPTDVRDFNISMIGGGVDTAENFSADSIQNHLITKGGGRIDLIDEDTTSGSDFLQFQISFIDSSLADDFTPSPYLIAGASISVSDNNLDFTEHSGITLRSPDNDDDNSYGYSTNGIWVRLHSPSGLGSTADTLELDWPETERVPLVYITSPEEDLSMNILNPANNSIIDTDSIDLEVITNKDAICRYWKESCEDGFNQGLCIEIDPEFSIRFSETGGTGHSQTLEELEGIENLYTTIHVSCQDFDDNIVTKPVQFQVQLPSCEPDWVLNDTWSECRLGVQSKDYYDANSCRRAGGQPAPITQFCNDLTAPQINMLSPVNDDLVTITPLIFTFETDEPAYCTETDFYGYPTNDVSPPNITDPYPTEEVSSTGQLTVGFTTDEWAICKGSVNEDHDYDNMSFEFSGYKKIHEKTLSFEESDDYSIFVKCMDFAGNVMNESFFWEIPFTRVGGGAGGGLGGGGGGFTTPSLSLDHQWEYEDLEDNFTYLSWVTCKDQAGNSGTEMIKFNTADLTCIESWSCTEFSACSDGSQTRTCVDNNACGTAENKPIEEQSCSAPSPSQNGGGGGGGGGGSGRRTPQNVTAPLDDTAITSTSRNQTAPRQSIPRDIEYKSLSTLPVEFSLGANEAANFAWKGENKSTIWTEEISEDKFSFTLKAEPHPITDSLRRSEVKQFDLDGDGNNDIMVFLQELSNGKARLSVEPLQLSLGESVRDVWSGISSFFKNIFDGWFWGLFSS
ncbi:hypothetical protein COV20_00100 [Candidatus Woesearchaeota archaeon CG10_big_fil_rev_8_21_14_0_10_45_16]|nr:MAG: hypothetical protein COV20_00100 [Candidatus Woesearchaeota archaeon CG10_big_fil_rev_8_21_14_0_10_45_16]